MTQPLSRLDGDTTERGRTSTYYAGVALCAADLGTDDDASRPATWTQEQKDAWADAPFRLTMADVAEAWKGRDRCADDHMWPKPTPVPCTVPSSDDGDCCTFEELGGCSHTASIGDGRRELAGANDRDVSACAKVTPYRSAVQGSQHQQCQAS